MDELFFAVFVVSTAFFLLNVLLTLLIGFAWRLFEKLTLKWSAKRRANFVFAFRVFPFVLSVSLLLFLFIPSFILHEQENPAEYVSLRLALLGSATLLLVVYAVVKTLLSLLKTRNLILKWEREENRLSLSFTKIPVYRIEYQHPVIAVFGLFKQKIFIDYRVFEILNDDEIEAVLAHEQAHINSLDNLKRLSLSFCHNLTNLPFCREIETTWENCSEAAADEFASRAKRTRPLDLASALVKLAREISNVPSKKYAIASYISSEAHTPVTWRVERLINLANSFPQKEEGKNVGSLILKFACIVFFIKFLLLVTHTDLLLITHQIAEVFVKLLI